MDAEIVLRQVASAAAHLLPLLRPPGSPARTRAPIALRFDRVPTSFSVSQ